jgi:hypothetical protein
MTSAHDTAPKNKGKNKQICLQYGLTPLPSQGHNLPYSHNREFWFILVAPEEKITHDIRILLLGLDVLWAEARSTYGRAGQKQTNAPDRMYELRNSM